MPSMELKSASAVIEALGGLSPVATLTRRKTPQVVWNWKDKNQFPPNTYVRMTSALKERGLKAPAKLWGQE